MYPKLNYVIILIIVLIINIKLSRIDKLMIQYFIIDNNLLFSLIFMLSLTALNCCSMISTWGRVGEMKGIYFYNMQFICSFASPL